MTRQEADDLLQLLMLAAAELIEDVSVLRGPNDDFSIRLLWQQLAIRYGTVQSDFLSIPTGDSLVSASEMVDDLVHLVLMEPHGRTGNQDAEGRFWI